MLWNLSLRLMKAAKASCVCQEYTCLVLQRDHCMKLWKKILHCIGDSRMLEISGWWDDLQTDCGSSPKERSMFQSTKLKWVGNPKNISTSNMEMQGWEFALLAFLLVLAQYFFIMLHFLPFRIVMYTYFVSLYVGSVLYAFWFLFYMTLQLRNYLESQKRFWTFK